MALDPSMQTGAPAPVAPPEAAPEASGGYVIELRVAADGAMSVSVEPDAPVMENNEGDPEGGDMGGEDAQPVANIGEAMKLIREIVAHAGEMTDTSASQGEMESGYGRDGM